MLKSLPVIVKVCFATMAFAVPVPVPAPDAINAVPTLLLAAPIRVKFVLPTLTI